MDIHMYFCICEHIYTMKPWSYVNLDIIVKWL